MVQKLYNPSLQKCFRLYLNIFIRICNFLDWQNFFKFQIVIKQSILYTKNTFAAIYFLDELLEPDQEYIKNLLVSFTLSLKDGAL